MKKKKIILVEDSEIILEVETNLVKIFGYGIMDHFTHVAALDALLDYRQDLALFDIGILDIDSLDVCRYIKNIPSFNEILVVMVSASDADENQKRWEQVRATFFISKSLSPDEVTKGIRRLVEQPSYSNVTHSHQAGHP